MYKRTEEDNKKKGSQLGILENVLSQYTPHYPRKTRKFSLPLPFPSPTRAAPFYCQRANMLDLWKEDGSLSQFDGSKPADVHTFFFFFENFATSASQTKKGHLISFATWREIHSTSSIKHLSRTETSVQMALTTRRSRRPCSSGLPRLNHLTMPFGMR